MDRESIVSELAGWFVWKPTLAGRRVYMRSRGHEQVLCGRVVFGGQRLTHEWVASLSEATLFTSAENAVAAALIADAEVVSGTKRLTVRRAG